MNKFLPVIILLSAISCSKKTDSEAVEKVTVNAVISQTVSVQEFQTKMHELDKAVILDVRTPEEVSLGYIEGAVNLDFRAPDFQEKINMLDKETSYLVYCAGGTRSRKAADLMKQHNFKVVYELQGGFTEWSGKGLPSVTP